MKPELDPYLNESLVRKEPLERLIAYTIPALEERIEMLEEKVKKLERRDSTFF